MFYELAKRTQDLIAMRNPSRDLRSLGVWTHDVRRGERSRGARGPAGALADDSGDAGGDAPPDRAGRRAGLRVVREGPAFSPQGVGVEPVSELGCELVPRSGAERIFSHGDEVQCGDFSALSGI